MQGMILAAGLGSRLHPLTLFRAKPAIPFLNRPLICHAVDLLRRLPLSELIVNLHHLPDSVIAALGEAAPRVHYSPEDSLLGTAGAVGRVRARLSADPFVVCNGKIYFEEDLNDVVNFHRDRGAIATLVLVPHSGEQGFRPARVDRAGQVVGFGSVGHPEDDLESYTFTGVQVLSQGALDFIPDGPSDLVDDLYLGLIREGYPVLGFVSKARWCECSTPGRYLRKSLEVLDSRGLDYLTGSILDKDTCHQSVVGQRVEVSPGSSLDRCVVWDDVRIGPDCSLSNSIVVSDVQLPPQTNLSEVIVTPVNQPEAGQLASRGRQETDYRVWPLS